MNDIVNIEIKDNCVNARDLWKSLEVKQRFNEWIKYSLRDYAFKENEDFYVFFSKSPIGRPLKEYAITLDMGKELSMLSKTSKSRIVRKYFIEAEKRLRSIYSKTEMKRIAGIEARKSMTDIIKEKGINEKMHGFAYSNFTKLVYKKLGIEYTKEKSFRDKLQANELKMIETMESLIKNYIELGYEYNQIKYTLPEILIKELGV